MTASWKYDKAASRSPDEDQQLSASSTGLFSRTRTRSHHCCRSFTRNRAGQLRPGGRLHPGSTDQLSAMLRDRSLSRLAEKSLLQNPGTVLNGDSQAFQ